jgi:hypothetical protein
LHNDIYGKKVKDGTYQLQPIYRLSVVLIISPILKGRGDKSSNLVIALLIVFRDENPIIVPAATLIAPAATLLTDENWNMIIMNDSDYNQNDLCYYVNTFSSLLSKFSESAFLLSKYLIMK